MSAVARPSHQNSCPVIFFSSSGADPAVGAPLPDSLAFTILHVARAASLFQPWGLTPVRSSPGGLPARGSDPRPTPVRPRSDPGASTERGSGRREKHPGSIARSCADLPSPCRPVVSDGDGQLALWRGREESELPRGGGEIARGSVPAIDRRVRELECRGVQRLSQSETERSGERFFQRPQLEEACRPLAVRFAIDLRELGVRKVPLGDAAPVRRSRDALHVEADVNLQDPWDPDTSRLLAAQGATPQATRPRACERLKATGKGERPPPAPACVRSRLAPPGGGIEAAELGQRGSQQRVCQRVLAAVAIEVEAIVPRPLFVRQLRHGVVQGASPIASVGQ